MKENISRLEDLSALGYIGDASSESLSLEALGLLFLLLVRKSRIEAIDGHTNEMRTLLTLISDIYSIRAVDLYPYEHWSHDEDFSELVQELKDHSSDVLSIYFGVD